MNLGKEKFPWCWRPHPEMSGDIKIVKFELWLLFGVYLILVADKYDQ